MILEGIDVSYYQGFIDWHSVRQANKVFAFIRCTEGLWYFDPNFQYNWNESRTNGLTRGAYHYFHPNEDAIAQADFLNAHVTNHGGFIPGDFIIIDIEEVNGEDTVGTINACAAFVERCTLHYKHNVILYTYPSFWLNTLGNPIDPVLSNCPLWLASYGPNVPTLANWPNGLSFWQYTDIGHCPGIQPNVDLSHFYGSIQQLKALTRPPL